MSAIDLILLYDYYGDLLTDRQKECFEMRYYQDLSLGEIGEELGISRQGVHDNIVRAEAHLQKMEAKTGCVRRYLQSRASMQAILASVSAIQDHADPAVRAAAARIAEAARSIEE